MRFRLTALPAFLTVLFYMVFSVVAGLIAAIFFGGIGSSEGARNIDSVIGSGMYGNIIVSIVLVFISAFVFRGSTRDILFERKPFGLSKWYYLFPLAWVGVTILAFSQVDYAAYSVDVILLTAVATLAIGANEEIVARGVLLVGLRNSRVAEWKVWVITVVVFALMHLVNLVGGGSPAVLLIVATGGTLLYVSRRVFGNLFVPIVLHALYDAAFYLLPGRYLVSEPLPDTVLDLQLGSFLVLLLVSIAFLVVGRALLQKETTGW